MIGLTDAVRVLKKPTTLESRMQRVPLARTKNMTAEQRAQCDRFPSNLTRGLLLAEQRLASAPPQRRMRYGCREAGWTEAEIAAIETG